MIISPILLPAWGGGESDFAIDLVNLEAAPLTFRILYTLTRPETHYASNSMTTQLNNAVRLKGNLSARSAWKWTAGVFRAATDVTIEPGTAQHQGIHVVNVVQDLIGTDNVSGRATLRGYWELTLPMVPSKSGRQVVQLDHPARVMIVVSHHAVGSGGKDVPSFVVLPLASGRAEHLIEPERPVPVARTPVAGMTTLKRAARTRKRR